MKKTYEIVSLGVNCMPRTVLTRNGVKPSKLEGELSCPFDLVAHKLPNIIHYLKTDFDDYFDDLYFDIRKRNFLDFRKKGFWKKKDGTVFNHDKDCGINDRDKLIKRFERRIENFYQLLNSNTPILFVLNLQSNPECVKELFEILKVKCKPSFRILIIDFKSLLEETAEEKIHLLQLPMPIENYHNGMQGWNNKVFRNSDLGLYVEKCICQSTKKALKELLKK